MARLRTAVGHRVTSRRQFRLMLQAEAEAAGDTREQTVERACIHLWPDRLRRVRRMRPRSACSVRDEVPEVAADAPVPGRGRTTGIVWATDAPDLEPPAIQWQGERSEEHTSELQ